MAKECDCGRYYRRSSFLQSLNAIPSSTITSILVGKVRVNRGTLRYRRNDENKCVNVSKNYENYFNAAVFEKVNTERRGPEIYPAEEEFYPTLHRLLTGRRNWREYLVYVAYADQTNSEKEKIETTKRNPLRISRQERMDGRYLSLRPSSYREDSRNRRDVIDMGLPEEDSKFLLSIWSAVLPIRVGAKLLLEPYYPNQSARQFGFDQGVLSNHLSFIRALRQQRNVMDLAQACANLQRRYIVAKFYIPPSYYEGVSSKVEEIFSVVKTAVKIEELVDVDWVKALSEQDLTCSSEIAHIKDQLNNLSGKASKLKVKE
ncbi:hypothetical protein Cgig2_025752 [Carnegiea gigantea]|uniref:Uncharacterized protein n=1 Tax=Carnegiea gigantea TaxID=171969 RepID=A0A9Q1JMJ5_9CARY|nr:hypothetical protein Cgig2_025752 [Carnegiea gigantea]